LVKAPRGRRPEITGSIGGIGVRSDETGVRFPLGVLGSLDCVSHSMPAVD
jgi:hypothetical protein